jgi:hypothetical protein
VSIRNACRWSRHNLIFLLEELDALSLEVEEEGPSYLADLNKAPDFIDEPPVEVGEASVETASYLQIFTPHPRFMHNRKQSNLRDDFNGYFLGIMSLSACTLLSHVWHNQRLSFSNLLHASPVMGLYHRYRRILAAPDLGRLR